MFSELYFLPKLIRTIWHLTDGYRVLDINGVQQNLAKALCDTQSQVYRSSVIDAIVNKLSANDVADAFDNYIHQAINRTFATRITNASFGSQNENLRAWNGVQQ